MKRQDIIIFDRSAFHGERFKLLVGSPIIRLVNKNHIHISHPEVFLEETINMFYIEGKRTELLNHMGFIFKICNKGWLKAPMDIAINEIANLKTNLFIKESLKKRAEKRIITLITNGTLKDLAHIEPEIALNKEKQMKWQETGVQIRNHIANGRKEYPQLKHQKMTFKEFQELDREGKTNLLSYGEQFIQRMITNDHNKIKLWGNNILQFPYLTSLIQGISYATYHAMFINERIDKNAGRDLELLCHLNHADILVSNDTGFLRSAFNALWGPKEKRLFTTEQFVNDYLSGFPPARE